MSEQDQTEIAAVTLSVPLVNAIVGYLGGRPFAEVQHLIGAVQQEIATQVADVG